MCQMQYTITQFGLIPRSWEARTAGEGMPISSSIMGLAADVRTREGLGHRDGAEHDKGPERLSKTPALFPLPQKRCGYYSGVGPEHSEGPEPSRLESSDPMREADEPSPGVVPGCFPGEEVCSPHRV